MPDFAYPSLAGDAVRLSDHERRVVLVNIGATWCPPCREEMPSMQRLYEAYGDSGFSVLAISIDSDTIPVRPFVEELELTFPILLDPRSSIGNLYGTAGVPESFVVDNAGRLVVRRLGADDWFSDANRSLISALLEDGRTADQHESMDSRTLEPALPVQPSLQSRGAPRDPIFSTEAVLLLGR